MLKLLAFDYGASSGRAILGSFDGNTLKLEEIHRFPNEPVMASGRLYWDILRLFHEMKQGILKCVKSGCKDIASIGTDTWGVDFGLLGPDGELMGNPVHYRDSRTDGIIEKASSIVPKQEIYSRTGIQFLKFNTLYQLLSMKLKNSPLLENAATLLFMPDLLNYFLTGVKVSEFTIASTSQMLDPVKRDWDRELLKRFGIPVHILADIMEPGKVVGKISRSLTEELNITDIPVVAVAGHDTASAVASVPAREGKYAYLSSGTWSLLGVESDCPVINDTTYELNYTNEGGINGTTRLLKNIMGLWIYQECVRTWNKTGEVLSFDELEEMSMQEEAFACFIDPDDDVFMGPGNMPEKIRDFCRRTGQRVPEGKGAVVRCIMESLALKYRMAVEGLEKIVGYSLPVIHVVGGGCKNTVLCRFTANSTGKPVIAGPVEATSVGNLICQLIGLGEVKDIAQAREIVRNSFTTSEYLPSEKEEWDSAYERFLKLVRGRE